MVDPFWADSVCAGESAFSSISWSDSAFEENNITKVEEIEMSSEYMTLKIGPQTQFMKML